jgi:hypothetical protein
MSRATTQEGLDMEMGMFSAKGNRLVSAVVTRVVGLELQDDAAWKYAYRELEALSELAGTEEATDTEVRESLFEELQKRNVIVNPDTVDYWFYVDEGLARLAAKKRLTVE